MLPRHRHHLVPDYICKIEGHGTLNIQFGRREARLEVREGERLFEGFMVGREYLDAPFITPRICGVCPTVHSLTSICALEKALDVQVSPETVLLRKVLLAGQMIQSHPLHAFFLALPDYLDVEDALEIAAKYPEEFNTALVLKRYGDDLIRTIGGREVHPVTFQVSGFDNLPSEQDLTALLHDAESVIAEAEVMVEIFGKLDYPDFECPTQYLAAKPRGEYTVYDASQITSNDGDDFDVADFDRNIKETVKAYSTAKFSTRNERGVVVGAQARLNLNGSLLNPRIKKVLDRLSICLPDHNPYRINLAQAIETMHFMEDIITLLNQLLSVDLENARATDYDVRAGDVGGACEAPRGTLYHAYELDNAGAITRCNIVTPTVQNLTNIEKDSHTVLDKTKHHSHKDRERLIEMLIRAYDPCITCSVH